MKSKDLVFAAVIALFHIHMFSKLLFSQGNVQIPSTCWESKQFMEVLDVFALDLVLAHQCDGLVYPDVESQRKQFID